MINMFGNMPSNKAWTEVTWEANFRRKRSMRLQSRDAVVCGSLQAFQMPTRIAIQINLQIRWKSWSVLKP